MGCLVFSFVVVVVCLVLIGLSVPAMHVFFWWADFVQDKVDNFKRKK